MRDCLLCPSPSCPISFFPIANIYLSWGLLITHECAKPAATSITNTSLKDSIIFEIAGASERINRFIKEVNQITKIEIVRSGPVAISTFKNTKED